MDELLKSSIQDVRASEAAWCRFITGNDTGKTGSHQAGFYVPKCASKLLFSQPGQKGENKEKTVRIKWQNDFETESCMKYYGQKTRNEYRITRLGRSFPFLRDEHVGDLLIIAKLSEEDYAGYVLSTEEDIDTFLTCFGLSQNQTNQLINIDDAVQPSETILKLLTEFVARYEQFPETQQMALGARTCYNEAYHISSKHLVQDPDEILLNWVETEYKLFKCMEEKLYGNFLNKPFNNVETFISEANKVLNRRKSRAGKSLEYHLANIFTANKLIFETQAITENNKRPDFIFPNGICYHNPLFPEAYLTVLGAKTSCKDRWRQVLTEANRVESKHLFTLQHGLSRNQLQEMHDANLRLVVPRKHITSFPKEYQPEILDLTTFIKILKERQEQIPKRFL